MDVEACGNKLENFESATIPISFKEMGKIQF